MKTNIIGETQLIPATINSPCSYELCGNQLIGRLFGVIPFRRIDLNTVSFMRLATRSETSPLQVLMNWKHFLIRYQSSRPVYILQTTNRQRIFLRLSGGAHFRLRQALNRHQFPQRQRIAA
ncbi:MAG TPA: hypothetical protein VIR77_05815 [Pontiella sp.]